MILRASGILSLTSFVFTFEKTVVAIGFAVGSTNRIVHQIANAILLKYKIQIILVLIFQFYSSVFFQIFDQPFCISLCKPRSRPLKHSYKRILAFTIDVIICDWTSKDFRVFRTKEYITWKTDQNPFRHEYRRTLKVTLW